MRKIFFYELRRMIASKSTAVLFAVCMGFGWMVLTTKTILGVSKTAPFSPWSFGAYLSDVMPALCAVLFAFLWRIYSKSARRVSELTHATPVSRILYLFTKCEAMAVAWLGLSLCTVLLGIGFLVSLFKSAVPVGSLLLCARIAILPAFVFVLGLGLLCGRIHVSLLLVVPLLLFGFITLPLPIEMELFCGRFFREYPLTLNVLDPAFSLPASFLIARVCYFGLGAGMVAIAAFQEKRQR